MTTTTRTALAAAATLWIVAAVGYVVLELLAAAAMPGYSYTEHYISSLGVPAWSPRSYLINAAFFLQGTLFFIGAVIVVRTVRGRWAGALFLVLAAANAVGNFLVGIVHGGSPLWEDGHEWLHVLGAILAILCGNAAIIAGSAVVSRAVAVRWYRPAAVLIGVGGLVIFAMLQNYNAWTVEYAPIGLVERACVYTIMIWQIFTGVSILAMSTRPAVLRD